MSLSFVNQGIGVSSFLAETEFTVWTTSSYITTWERRILEVIRLWAKKVGDHCRAQVQEAGVHRNDKHLIS